MYYKYNSFTNIKKVIFFLLFSETANIYHKKDSKEKFKILKFYIFNKILEFIMDENLFRINFRLPELHKNLLLQLILIKNNNHLLIITIVLQTQAI